MKFLLDMGISPYTTKFLRAQGHDAVRLPELRLSFAADQNIIEFARRSERVILTHDLDFGTLMVASGERLPSIVIFRLADMKPANVNQYLEVVIMKYAEELATGVILSISERRIRVRRLPMHPEDF